MQVAQTQVTYTPIQTTNIFKDNDTEVKKYLKSIGWDIYTFSNARLESILTASCLRYLAGLTDIDFVIELSKEIYKKYKKSLKLSLIYSTEILTNLSDKLDSTTNQNTINELVNDAQEVITGRRYNL